ncbi:hypothetical protein [Aliiglaciecola litoralis]
MFKSKVAVFAAVLLLFLSSSYPALSVEKAKQKPTESDPDVNIYAWTPKGTKLWPSPNIRVCFDAFGDWTTSDIAFTQRSEAIRNTLEVALNSLKGSGTALTVYGWEVCPEPGTPSLLNTWRISLQFFADGRPDGRASADLGYNPSRETGVAFGGDYPLMGIVHEFAHALGFQHEWWRHDITEGCTQPLGGGAGGNEGQHSSEKGEFLTAYDPNSINNQTYCGLFRNDGVFTEADKAAIAFLYPNKEPAVYITDQIAFDGGIVVPESSNLDVKNGWTQVGILASAANIDECDLGLGNSFTEQKKRLKVNKKVNITCHFKDYWGRKRTSSAISLIKSDTKFSSVVVAAIY